MIMYSVVSGVLLISMRISLYFLVFLLSLFNLLNLFQSQQKCIVIFALVCCFAILVALIFSAVDIMGEDEDGLSEKNCQNNCR